ncbi:hypothetical protein ACFL6D_04730 [Spirochaetota bacterium]
MKKLCIFFCMFSLFLSAADVVRIIKVEGKVKIIADGKIITAKVNDEVKLDAVIKTFKGAKLVISLADGTLKTVNESTAISVKSLLGKSKKHNLLNLFLKIKKDTTPYASAPSAIAGVRGAEQGTKGSFGVKWQQNAKPDKKGSNPLFDRGEASFRNEEYDTAIETLITFLKDSKDDKQASLAHYYIGLSYIELLQYEDALKHIEASLKKSPEKKVEEALTYYKALCHYFLGEKKDLTKTLKAFFKDYPSGQLYWSAKSLHFFYLANEEKTKEAQKLKDEILMNCNDQEINDKISAVDL